MITIGRQFYIKGNDDGFVKIRFKCIRCKRRCSAIMIDVVALEVAAGRIVCNRCDMDAWVRAAIILCKNEEQDLPDPKQVALTFNVLT
jgi:hypothetical protein